MFIIPCRIRHITSEWLCESPAPISVDKHPPDQQCEYRRRATPAISTVCTVCTRSIAHKDARNQRLSPVRPDVGERRPQCTVHWTMQRRARRAGAQTPAHTRHRQLAVERPRQRPLSRRRRVLHAQHYTTTSQHKTSERC